ncbi:MAG: MlaD family protein [bacterium]
MKVTSAIKVGFTVIIVLIVLAIIYKGMGIFLPGLSRGTKADYKLTVSFRSVKGLEPGSDVLLNGNPVGEVGEIRNDEFSKVRVLLLIRLLKDLYIHENAVFEISRENLFGGFKISINEPPTGRLLTENPPADGNYDLLIAAETAQKGGEVRFRGEIIGTIEEVTNHNERTDHVIMHMAQAIELNSRMSFVPTGSSNGLTGITVFRALPDGSEVDGDRQPGPEDLVATANIALLEIQVQAVDLLGKMSELIDNINGLIDTQKLNEILDTLTAEAKAIGSNVESLTRKLNLLLDENSPHITATLENVESITSEARGFAEGLNQYNNPELRDNIIKLVENLKIASDSLTEIMKDIEEMTSDEGLKNDIRGTLTQTRETIEQAKETLSSADIAIKEASGAVKSLWGFESNGQFKLRYLARSDNWAGDLDVRFSRKGSDSFVALGIDDIGENNKGNIQFGWWANYQTSARVGIHRGKVGAGLDWRSDAYSFVNELYDPNDLRWDVYAGYAVMPELDLVMGVEDVLDDPELNLAMNFRF